MSELTGQEAKPSKWKRPIANVLFWFLLVVVTGLLSFFFNYCFLTITKRPFSLPEALSHGELFLLSTALVGEIFYELILKESNIDRVIRAGIIVGGFFVLVGSIGLYAFLLGQDIEILAAIAKFVNDSDPKSVISDLANLRSLQDQLDVNVIMYYSLGAFVPAVVIGIIFRWVEK